MGLFRIVFELLVKVVLMVGFVWLVRGSVERERLFLLLGLAVLARGYFLWREWRKPRVGDARWLEAERAHAWAWWLDEREDGLAAGDGAAPGAEVFEKVDAEVERTRSRDDVREAFARLATRREDRDILSEAVCLVTLAPGAFLLALMLSSPVVTWTGFDRGPAMVALAAGAGLHFAANLIPARFAARRVMMRTVLVAAVIGSGLMVARTRHPYLLEVGPEHRRLIAERVWELGRSIEAGRYAGLLVAYARDLEVERRWADARLVYERALSLDAYRSESHEGLARVLDALGETEAAAESRLAARRTESFQAGELDEGDEVEASEGLPLFHWQPTFRHQVCLVPVGDVSDELLNAAGHRLGRVLEVEVYRWPGVLPLPKAERRAGWLGGDQWRAGTVMDVFRDHVNEEMTRGRRIAGAWQFILVTSGDLYVPDANYVFAVAYPVHGVVSCARFGGNGDGRQAARLGKQLVATAMKGFGVGQAGRADCVTAYARSLEEHDRKPLHPAGPTRTEYRKRVKIWERDPAREPEAPW